MNTQKIQALVAGLLTAPALLLGLAACSSSSETADSALGGGTQNSSANTKAQDEWNMKITECLREQGVEIVDPTPGEPLEAPDDDRALEVFQQVCSPKVGAPPATGNEVTDAQAAKYGVAWAQCARDAGYDVKDPEPGMALSLDSDIPENVMSKCDAAANEAIDQ